MEKSPKICLLVSNDLTHDPRVQKQAETASKAGFHTLVLAWMTFEASKNIQEVEETKGYGVLRGIFMPHWSEKRYLFLNLKLTRFNLPISFNIITFSFFKFTRGIRRVLLKIIITVRKFFLRRLVLYTKFLISVFSKIKNITRIFAGNLQKGLFKLTVLTKTLFGLKNFKIKRKIYRILNLSVQSSAVRENPVMEALAKTAKDQPVSGNNQTSNPDIPAPPKKINYFHRLNNSYLRVISSAQFYLTYYRQMNKYLISQGINYYPDIVHANDLDTLWAGWQIKRKTGAKLIYDAHEIWTDQGLQLPGLLLKIYSLMEWFLFRKVDYFITVNESIAFELKRRYRVKNLPTAVVYNCPRYKKSLLKVANSSEIKVLYQGRYSADRGLEQLAQAGRYLNKNIKLYFRGTGSKETRQKLEEIAKKLKIQNQVAFLEPVPMSELIRGANEFDIGIVAYIPTNINNYYCLPNKIYEYMMAGLALGVSNLPELKRIIKDNRNGVVFNPAKPRDIAKNINLLAKNVQKLNQTKQNSLLGAKKNNWDIEEKKLVKIYEQFTVKKS